MTHYSNLDPDVQLRLDRAAEWRVRLKSDPASELSPEFLEWISEPRNYRVFRAVDEGWSAVEDLGASPELLDMRRSALTRARRSDAKRWPPRRTLFHVAAVLSLVALLGLGVVYVYLQEPATYRTQVGERRVISLPDGSRISLDSDTEAKVRYTMIARSVELDHGRARFDVAHDVSRPFMVTAGDETVVAIGTSFNVEKIGSKVLVTLIQGHVVIKSAATMPEHAQSKPQVSLDAGQELVASLNMRPQIRVANLAAATAWEEGQLIFRDVTLEDAVARENRYTDRPVIVDPSAATVRISGVFNAGDVTSFVSAVTSYFPVEATRSTAGHVLLRKHP